MPAALLSPDASAMSPAGDIDEPPIIPVDMHPPIDLAEDLDHFLAQLAGYLKPGYIHEEVAEEVHRHFDINTKGGRHYRFAVTKITNKALYGDGYRVGYGEIERVGVKRKDSGSFLFD